jgi:nitrite reductase/ring-hydroxylating ferredoxin subunit
MLVEVCSVADVKEGVPTVHTVDGREILVTKWRGGYYALRNVCAHRAVALATGGRVGASAGCGARDHVGDFLSHVGDFVSGGAIGDWNVHTDVPVIKCPWHSWQFKLTDGACMSDPQLRVKSYEVVVKDDRILIEISSSGRRGQRQTHKDTFVDDDEETRAE